MSRIIATAWNNGRHHPSGAGYGLKIPSHDRDQYYRREWGTVELIGVTDLSIKVNIDKEAFWNDTCRELISAPIGRWMISNALAPWPERRPPSFTLIPRASRVFEIHR